MLSTSSSSKSSPPQRAQFADTICSCESEFRSCYLNDQFDHYAESVLANWNTWCNDYVTFVPTTPVLSNPTTTVPTIVGGVLEPFCSEFRTSCDAWSMTEAD